MSRCRPLDVPVNCGRDLSCEKRDLGVQALCLVEEGLFPFLSRCEETRKKRDADVKPKRSKNVQKRCVEIACLRVHSDGDSVPDIPTGSVRGDILAAEVPASMQFLEVEDSDIVMVSAYGEKVLKVQWKSCDDRVRQVLKVGHNKCLEQEVSNAAAHKSERTSPMARPRSRRKKSPAQDAVVAAKRLVSRTFKDLNCEICLEAQSSGGWVLRIAVSLMYLPQTMNKFSHETKFLLDTLFARDGGTAEPLPPSPFIQSKFVAQTVAYTRGRLTAGAHRGISGLQLHLLPFQSETVEWMLSKETHGTLPHVLMGEDDILRFLNQRVSYGYEAVSGNTFWNKFTNFVLTRKEVDDILADMLERHGDSDARARGLLCEEMGLGKTIEVLSLILLNRRRAVLPRTFVAEDGKTILHTKTTLIICPNAILQQWVNEVEAHTSGLSIFHYKGFLSVKKFANTDNISEIVEQLSQYDIIITSYNVVSMEVHYAEYNASSRPRRTISPIKYDYSSPLSLMQFFRIILDEVQMLHSDSTKAAKCTSLLHRVHTWGVSGTPIQLVKDFQTVLSYLQISPFHELPEIVAGVNNNVVHHQEQQLVQGVRFTLSELLNLFIKQDLSVRHSKEDVMKQIHIPKQYNYIVPLEFAPVEWDNYLDLWNTFLTVSGYGASGTGNPRLTNAQLNQWLARLRYLCCHAVIPDSHLSNTRNQGNSSSATLHNIDDVLRLMTADAVEKLDSLYRDNYLLQIKSAQAKTELQNNPEGAIKLLQSVKENLYSDLREKCLITDPLDTTKASLEERDGSPLARDLSEGASLMRRRAYLDLLHQCFFFIATAYYNKGSSKLEEVDQENEQLALKNSNEKPKTYSEVYSMPEMEEIEQNQLLEQQYYSYAERLRKRILIGRVQKVHFSVKEIQKYFQENPAFKPQSLQMIEFDDGGNYSGTMLVSRCFTLLASIITSLNEQAMQFNGLFAELKQLVYAPILKNYDENNEDDKAQEYSSSIDDQDKMFALFACMEQLLANRDAISTSDETIKISKNFLKPQAGQKFSEYHSKLLSGLNMISGSPLKPIFDELKNAKVVRNVSCSTRSGNNTKEDFEDYLLRYESQLFRITKENKGMRESLKKLNSVYNAKLEYYSQLQKISDSLIPLLQLENAARSTIVKSIKDDTQYRRNLEKISSAESRVKYLTGLTKLKESIEKNQKFSCAICLGTIHTGSIIKCGHFFCRKCIHSWLKSNHSCPLCKTKATLLEVYNFKFQDEPDRGVSPSNDVYMDEGKSCSTNSEEIGSSSFSRENLDPVLREKYSLFPQFDEVHKMVIKESFGAKIDFVIKLILFLKLKSETEENRYPPQILIYSQSFEFLKVITAVLNIHEIKHLSCLTNVTNVGEAISRFKNNSSITCLLLNVKSLGAGLNLLNARHVFLLDPIINRGDELQAMSRNNRIGQTEETYVWNFMIKNSVEENILKYKCLLEGRRKLLGRKSRVKQEELDATAVDEEREELEMNESTGEQVSGRHLKSCFFSCNA
ncbi:related to Irc20p [Zygosaccharomyces bailii]|nr:related to Irc20p [Zygosaccharomyces bailii]